MSNKPSNPVIDVIHGIEIKKYNYVQIMFGTQAFKDLIKEAAVTGLSIPKLVAIKSQPCQQCGCDNVTLTIAKDGRVNKQNTSQNIIEKNSKP